jgi:ADP-heptose:LPS heptosyltransferase
MPKPKHILVIRLSAMGDVAMTVPILSALTRQHPKLKITVLTKKPFANFFRNLENVNVFEADIKGKHKGILGLYRLSRELKKGHHFCCIADLHNVLRSKILRNLIKSEHVVSIDKGRAEKKALVTGKVFKQLKTTHQRYADVFESLGFSVDLSNPTFQQKIRLNKSLKKYISTEKKIIGIAPFAAHEGKMYPLKLMEEVVEKLNEDYHILLFGGGKEEVRQLDLIEDKYQNVVSVAGKLSLGEELDLISNLDLMLSMDSGNGHMAAMLGINVISLWGVTHPYAGFLPFNHSIDSCLLADKSKFPKIPTSIYGNKYPEGYEFAMTTILPETIVEKIESAVQKSLV